uniref:Uncharacterized protein LOC105851203 n=1 Tax=Cicer arietinum TaxID=3827 RepID=A0A1S3DVQ3_CICAR|nr:uncharacterized protein LOC105851203 [Cicer arietinum]
MVKHSELLEQFRDLSLVCEVTPESIKLGMLKVTSGLLEEIENNQELDLYLLDKLQSMDQGREPDFKIGVDEILRFKEIICVSDVEELRKMILEEGHRSCLSIHPRATKMYKDLKKIFWWPKMKKDVAEFVYACLTCQKSKVEYQKPSEFTYNNSFHSSIGMDPCEALYGRRCRTPLYWFETSDNLVLGPEIVQQTTGKVKMIQEKMRASQSRQKSYHDKRRKNLEFQEGDHIFLRVTPTTRVGRPLKMRKLTPRFIGPYQILKRVGNVAYQIALPSSLSNLHSVFHVSQLRKYIFDPSHVIESDKVQIKDNLTFETLPQQIEDQKTKELRGKTISFVKVVWGGATGERVIAFQQVY